MLSIELFIFIILVVLEVSLLYLLSTMLKKLNLFSKSSYKPFQKDDHTFKWKDKLSS